MADRLKDLIRLENKYAQQYTRWTYRITHMPGNSVLLYPFGILAGLFLLDLLIFHNLSWLWPILAAIPGYFYVRSVLKDLKPRKEARQNLANVLSERQQLLAQINQLATGRQVDDWWNTLKPFQVPNTNPHIVTPLVWMPSERLYIRKPENRLSLRSMCTETDRISGTTLRKMLNSGDYRVLYNKGINSGSNYKIADLCHWLVRDGSYTYMTSASEESIARDMQAFEQKQDDRERFWNTWEDSLYVTDEERYTVAQMGYTEMSYADLAESRMWRQLRTAKHEEKLRSATYTKITDIDKYSHTFWPVGVIVFDDTDHILAILLHKNGYQRESYITDHNKLVYDVDLDVQADATPFSDTSSVLFHLREFPLDELDVLAAPPEGFSKQEWLLLLYGSYHPGDIQNTIRNCYTEANSAKKKAIARA